MSPTTSSWCWISTGKRVTPWGRIGDTSWNRPSPTTWSWPRWAAPASTTRPATTSGGLAMAGPVHDRRRRAPARRGSGGPTDQLVQLAEHDSAIATRLLAVAHHLDLVRLELLQQGKDLGHAELVVVGDRELQIVVLLEVPSTVIGCVLVAIVLEAIVREAIVVVAIVVTATDRGRHWRGDVRPPRRALAGRATPRRTG